MGVNKVDREQLEQIGMDIKNKCGNLEEVVANNVLPSMRELADLTGNTRIKELADGGDEDGVAQLIKGNGAVRVLTEKLLEVAEIMLSKAEQDRLVDQGK